MSNVGLRVAASTSRAARVASRSCRLQSRALHQRRQLSYPVEEGLGTFLPPHSLKMIAEDYQQGLLDRLNDQVRGTSLENKGIVQTIIDSARDPDKVLEFNYASEALNNSFFLGNLRPPPADATSHEAALHATTGSDPSLIRRIAFHYGSLAHFKSNFSAAVLGMFSSGWIWLVTDQEGQLGIVPTFGTGTLLVRSAKPSPALEEWQRIVGEAVPQYYEEVSPTPIPTATDTPAADIDASAPSSPLSSSSSPSPSVPSPAAGSPVSGVTHGAPGLDPHSQTRTMATMLRPRGMYGSDMNGRGMYGSDMSVTLNQTDLKDRKVGETLFPLFCISVHEHAWVGAGYGVWGKEEYMKRFWSVVDWEKAVKVYEKVAKGSGPRSY